MATNRDFLVKNGLIVTDDITLDDGGSLKEAGGTAAFTFDGSGNVTKIGQDSPSSGEFLKWDGSKWVADGASGGATLSNDANNRIVTADGSGGINGEANLTFDGSTLALAGKQTITVDDTVSEAFKVTITDTDSTADSTPFVVDGDGRVGIGTASPVSGFALTLNGDGTSYEGIAFQSGGSTKFKQSTDGSAMYFDSAINTGNVNFRMKDSGGNLRPALGIEGSNFSVAVGYNGTSGSALNPQNTFQVNVGTENGVQDKDDGILLLNSDLSIADGDTIGGIGFATRDGNIPSVTTEAAAAIVAYAAEDHSTGDKGGHLAFLTSAIDDDDDTASNERMRIQSDGNVIIGSTTSQHDSLGKLTVKGTDASFLLEKHDDGASGGPSMTLYRYSASVADSDLIGQVNFRGEGSTGNPSTYMSLRTEIIDTTEGTKDGNFIIRGLQANTQTEFMQIGQKVQIGPESINPSGITTGKVTISRDDTDATGPTLMLVDGDDDANAGPSIKMYRNSASPADNDTLGNVAFVGEDSAGGERTYAGITGIATDVTSGTTDAALVMKVMQAGTQTDMFRIDENGVKAMIAGVKAVSSNTTLTDNESGSYVYWTGGTLTLPATAIKGQQFTVINNTGGSATPSLGTSNSIATGWTAHAAMDDETARTYISVAANTWIYIG